jgi:hypothetical protein
MNTAVAATTSGATVKMASSTRPVGTLVWVAPLTFFRPGLSQDEWIEFPTGAILITTHHEPGSYWLKVFDVGGAVGEQSAVLITQTSGTMDEMREAVCLIREKSKTMVPASVPTSNELALAILAGGVRPIPDFIKPTVDAW